ncbi:ParA family protein [Salmonella enterica]|nr:ParA family protein [Salmonella enterica]EJF5839837.1 ParA family protein [Salmonella enterica]EJF6007293.1 ParA family protein [Salmonella enterica]EJF6164750.1 ParA family protein [Salmonella enterica]ELE9461372.1 ParA family protein [Salmonella enterica]
MAIIANAHPKGGVGKTTSSVNLIGEMKTDAVDLDTHTGLSIILGLRPDGKEISVKVPHTVEELIEIMRPYKNSDEDLFIDCGGFDSDLTRTAVAFADCVIVPSKDSLTERIGLMHFDGVLDEISSIMETDITAYLYLCKVNPNKKNFPKLEAILSSFKHLKLMNSRISSRAEFEEVIESGMGITETLHGRTTPGGKEVMALVQEIKQLIADKS